MSATSTVLDLPEILQQVLSELPPFDIIRCQLVNRTWHRLIANSPLLQYKAWLRNDYPDPIYHVKPDDLMAEADSDVTKEFGTKRFLYNIGRHLNPVIVARVMEDIPRDPSYSFDPARDLEKYGFGGYFNFRPVLVQALLRWYNANKASEDKWTHVSLFRPEAHRLSWEVPGSDDSIFTFRLEAQHNEKPDAQRYARHFMGHDYVANKRPGEPLFLTLRDLLGNLERLWERWLDNEREIHYMSHEGGGCDSVGLPDHSVSSDSDGDEDMDEDMDDKEAEAEDCKLDLESAKWWARNRLNLGAEYYIDRCVRRASD
jgi:hypothetical protein